MQTASSLRATLMAMISIVAMSACTLDDEAELRSEVESWLSLQDTVLFTSEMRCSAAIYRASSGVLRSTVRRATNIQDGLRLMSQGQTVVFDIQNRSPNDISQAMMVADSGQTLPVHTSGLAGRDCLPEAERADYFAALNTPGALLIYDPERKTFGVLRPNLKLIFIARGDA